MLDKLYSEYQPLLFSIAYQMLGSVSDAEDIVHDVYLRVGERKIDHVENNKAYLCKMVTNSCLDYLKSAQKKREVYCGPWLPEPIISQKDDPFFNVIKGEMISFAVMLLLEKLKPIERAVFILREVLDYDYFAIAEIVDRTETTCRKIFSRVKKKVPMIHDDIEISIDDEKEGVIQTFISAISDGNLNKLELLLSHDVTLYSDGGGKVNAAIRPVHSREFVLRFLSHLLENVSRPEQMESILKVVNINGQTGLVAIGPDNVKTVICFEVTKNQIQNIFIVRNPDKLKHVVMNAI